MPALPFLLLGGGDTDPPVTPSLRPSLSHEALAALHFYTHSEAERRTDGEKERGERGIPFGFGELGPKKRARRVIMG